MEKFLMDFGWKFKLEEVKSFQEEITALGAYTTAKAGFARGPAGIGFDDSSWRDVDIPHDWVVEGEFSKNCEASHGFLPAGVAWYRKTFMLPLSDEGKKIYLMFDGVFRNSTVLLNGHRIGNNFSGYTGFFYDVTDVIIYGGINTLAVNVNATAIEGWWYEGAGIYRHVWLMKANTVHVDVWGTFVHSSPNKDYSSAVATIQTKIKNDSEKDAEIEVGLRIVDATSIEVKNDRVKCKIESGKSYNLVQQVEVDKPALWSDETPNLYKLETTIYKDGKEVDNTETKFGIRDICFDKDEGFFINGKQVKLKGTCNHQDHGGVGIALPDRIYEYRIEKLKEMGCNAYRCAHNPPAPELLDACDKLGMFVMDENRKLDSSDEGLFQLRSMVLRDRNHPSVILWSIKNEEPLQANDSGTRIAGTMKKVVKELDPTRPVTAAMNGYWGFPFSQVLDVMGCNYFIPNYDLYHKNWPDSPMVGSETASTVSTRGVYVTDKEKGYVTAYDVNVPNWGATAENAWKAVVDRKFISGTFVWTGLDYRGEPTPYNWPCINSHFGIMDMAGFPKDNYFYYKAWWTNETVLHVFPHWNWTGREGEEIDVWAHGNCERVELFLNGKSLGAKNMERNSHCEWKVKYEPGKLTAKGYSGGKEAISAEVETTGKPERIILVPDRATIREDAEDVSMVKVYVVDSANRMVPDADNEISFRISAGGKIIGVANGDPSSHEPDKGTRRRLFNGLAMVIVQSGKEKGNIMLTAESHGLKTAMVEIKCDECERRKYIPPATNERQIIMWKSTAFSEKEPDVRNIDFEKLGGNVSLGDGPEFGDAWLCKDISKPGYVSYHAKTRVPKYDTDKELLVLVFGRIIGDAKIFINGNLSGEWKKQDDPIEVMLKNSKPGDDLRIDAVVRGYDKHNGISRPVVFEKRGKTHG